MFRFAGLGKSWLTFCLLLVWCLSINLTVAAQSVGNAILLDITRVTKDGRTQDTQKTANNTWVFNGELNLDDAIRYQWNAVSLDESCRDRPQRGCGYLKIYLGDDSQEANFITDYGSSPLPVDRLASKLKEGQNTLMFVYYDNNNRPAVPETKVLFTFNFRNVTNKPQIRVVNPSAGSLLAKGINRDFLIELTNFQLESTNSNQPNRGKLNIYYNQINNANLVGTLSASTTGADNKSQVKFNTKDLEFFKIPDNLDTELIFALTNSLGQLIDVNTSLRVKTNFNNSINVGLPKITIQEPRKDRTDLSINGNQKFIVQVENFQVLSEVGDGVNEEGKGYMQIFVDEAPIRTFWPRTDFSFNEIGAGELSEGRKTIKVQLVNKDYTKLLPEAVDTIDVVFTPEVSQDESGTQTQVENNTWRIVIVILTIILVIGGIAVLITKG